MNKWLRKSLFVLISVITFGLVTPSQLMNSVNAENISDKDAFEAPVLDSSFSSTSALLEETDFTREAFIENIIKQAEIQSYQKFGSKIKPVIETEFREVILPNIEKALAETSVQFPDEDLKNLTITEKPGAGLSEKIFNIEDRLTGKDILRFHIRRDNPPQEGYWFNFHYHTYHDEFQNHYELGSIFWAKDTPPKWMN